jgi:hypothetical protein
MAAFRGVVSHGIESTESKFWILEKKASDLLRAVKTSITESNVFFGSVLKSEWASRATNEFSCIIGAVIDLRDADGD